MIVTQWNEEEDEALQGLPHLAQLLYLRVLRRYMDYRTGIVGRTRRISYQMMKEVLEVERARGSTVQEAITVKAIRVALAQLEAAGLIVRLPRVKRFDPQAYLLVKANIDCDFFEDSESAGSICPQEEGQRKGKRARARGGQRENVIPMRVAESFPQRGRAEEGQRRKGNHPEIKIDRQIDTRARVDSPGCPQPDADGVPPLGEAIAMLVDGGVRHSLATSTDHRLLLADLLKAGATRSMLQEAIRRAQLAKRGKPWSVFYIEPIVRGFLSPVPQQAGRPGGSHASHQLRRQSGAGVIAEGCADALAEFEEDEAE